MKKVSNEFEPFLNECQTYVWEWYIPEHKVRFGIPSLNRLWIDDKEKNIKLATMLERVHPDDIQKVLVRKTSPLFRSDKMFEVDLRLNVADELMPAGAQSSGKYEWYGFRGKTIRRDEKGQPTYVRGVAINLDQRYRAQMKLIAQKEHQLQSLRHMNHYCLGVMQEVHAFMRDIAKNANSLISAETPDAERVQRFTDLQSQAERILLLTDKLYSSMGGKGEEDADELKPLCLWEHLAELMQIYSLKSSSLKFVFSNPYDRHLVYINVRLLDLLIENIVNIDQRNKMGGTVSLNYKVQVEVNRFQLAISFENPLSEGGLGISVCRILAKRLWGDVTMTRTDNDRVEYLVSLPIDARNTIQGVTALAEPDTLDQLDDDSHVKPDTDQTSEMYLPDLLLGVYEDEELFKQQHLYHASVCSDTDTLLDAFRENVPSMIFVDYHLMGKTPIDEVIRIIHALQPFVPIIVSADEADRPLHKHIRQLGAQYLLTNPVTQRKVNMMVKRFLR